MYAGISCLPEDGNNLMKISFRPDGGIAVRQADGIVSPAAHGWLREKENSRPDGFGIRKTCTNHIKKTA
jgi:hypothetical protein